GSGRAAEMSSGTAASSGGPGGGERVEDRGDLGAVVQAGAGGGLSRPDLDRQVLRTEHGEDVLVGDVVAEVDDRVDAQLPGERLQCGALVRADDAQLVDALAGEEVDPGHPGGLRGDVGGGADGL